MYPVHASEFFHDGRGPELVAVHFSPNSSHLLAVDFRNPDSSETRHLVFTGAQSFMFTPDEVVGDTAGDVEWGSTQGGALVSLGRSAWLESFNQAHLEKCEHLRAMFYDQQLDLICEDVSIHKGGFKSGL